MKRLVPRPATRRRSVLFVLAGLVGLILAGRFAWQHPIWTVVAVPAAAWAAWKWTSWRRAIDSPPKAPDDVKRVKRIP